MWDARYSEDGYAYGTNPNVFLEEQSYRLTDHSRVLCLAEGEGRNAVFLAERGHRVRGVDSSSIGLEKASALAKSKNVSIETETADLASYDLGDSEWDGIVSIFCHLPPPLRKRVHQSIARALVPGGILILQAYTPKQLDYKTGGPPVAEMMMTIDELKTELDGLDFELGEELERDVVEGKYHTGKAHVVQVVAKKP